MKEIKQWDLVPLVGDESYGVYFPVDGFITHGFINKDEAENYIAQLSQGHESTKGAYVVWVQIEKVED